MIVVSVMRGFGAPMFPLWTMTSSNYTTLQYLSGRASRCWKSEFVKQLLALKRFIMTNPPERIVWSYGRHQPDLFRSLPQELPCIEFYEGLPMNIEGMLDRSK